MGVLDPTHCSCVHSDNLALAWQLAPWIEAEVHCNVVWRSDVSRARFKWMFRKRRQGLPLFWHHRSGRSRLKANPQALSKVDLLPDHKLALYSRSSRPLEISPALTFPNLPSPKTHHDRPSLRHRRRQARHARPFCRRIQHPLLHRCSRTRQAGIQLLPLGAGEHTALRRAQEGKAQPHQLVCSHGGTEAWRRRARRRRWKRVRG